MMKEPLPGEEKWFEVKPAAEGVRRIDDHGTDNLYLVEGEVKALLIDTGIGSGDLAGCVGDITRLPVIVVNTHGHMDHAGGNRHFPAVHAHPLDFEAIKQISARTAGSGSVPSLQPVREGDMFDLGGRKLEVIEAPGHTPGSIVLLDSANKLLFTGDTNNIIVWMFLKECLPLETYLRTLMKLERRSGEFDVLLPGHGDALDALFLREQMICAQQILGGECRGEKYDTFAGSGLLCSYKRAGIAYNPENLHLRPPADGKTLPITAG
jgi:hydroxyacylglutathione hydrolase